MKRRTLKTLLRRSGFICRLGKGSHSIWTHPAYPDVRLVLAGNDSDDVKPYQVARARTHPNRSKRKRKKSTPSHVDMPLLGVTTERHLEVCYRRVCEDKKTKERNTNSWYNPGMLPSRLRANY